MIGVKSLNGKRCGAVLLSLCLLSGCAGGEKAPGNVSLYDRGLALIEKIDSMAESEEYMGMVSGSPEVMEIIKEIGAGDYGTPRSVWKVTLSEEAVDQLLEFYGAPADRIPQELAAELRQRLLETIPTMLSSGGGASALAAASVATSSDYFIDPDLSENVQYFYLYEGKYGAAVTFCVHDEHIVSAQGRFIVNEQFGQMTDFSGLEEILATAGLTGVEISRVEGQDGQR